jgi:methionine-gamma-lyase
MNRDSRDDLAPDSLAIHADRDLNDSHAVAPPIWQTSTFWADSGPEFLDMATAPRHDRFYTRYGNPNHSQVEAVVAALEGADAAMVTSSGMAAITGAVLANVSAGDHVVAQTSLYAGTIGLLKKVLPRFGVEATLVDQRDPQNFAAAIRPNTRLIVVETPSNPVAAVTDLAAVAELARGRGIITIADNTFATPVNQRPLALGIDLVVHSATKYLGGHSDLVAGVVVGPAGRLQGIWEDAIALGSSPAPFDAWLLLRGLRTLPLRVARHNRSAAAIAAFLEGHPAVSRVHYAGLESHPQHDVARRQMSGFGGVVSFELGGGFEAAERAIAAMRLPRRAASLGGVESLVVHPAAMWAGSLDAEQLAASGIEAGLIRLSVGLEDERDLIADLERALG